MVRHRIVLISCVLFRLASWSEAGTTDLRFAIIENTESGVTTDNQFTRTDMLDCVADTAAALELSISAVADVANAAEWNCTMQFDAFDQQLHAELASARTMLANHMQNRLSTSSRALHLLQKLMCRPDGAQLFLEFDTDGDGTVSREELKEGYAKIGEHLSEEDMDAIMALVDQDGDGAIGYGEFVQMGKMTEDVEALRMTMQANLAQLKAESEETMVQKIIPLEESLKTTRNDLESNADEFRASISSHVDMLRSDMNGAMPTVLVCCSTVLVRCHSLWLF
jgi:hypothetical protein